MSNHKQVRIKAPAWAGVQRISVDEQMAPLLRELLNVREVYPPDQCP